MPEFPGSPFCSVESFEKYLNKLNPQCESLRQRLSEAFSDEDISWRLGQDTNEYSLRLFLQDNSSTIAEIQRINVGDILSDFESEITATAASVQIRQILPAFHGCTILLP
uniref:Uncharacterized protein n=1 Tax=Magallana gigas TaxID=29159 RepID=A0A8W8HKQ2_MAGGI